MINSIKVDKFIDNIDLDLHNSITSDFPTINRDNIRPNWNQNKPSSLSRADIYQFSPNSTSYNHLKLHQVDAIEWIVSDLINFNIKSRSSREFSLKFVIFHQFSIASFVGVSEKSGKSPENFSCVKCKNIQRISKIKTESQKAGERSSESENWANFGWRNYASCYQHWNLLAQRYDRALAGET